MGNLKLFFSTPHALKSGKWKSNVSASEAQHHSCPLKHPTRLYSKSVTPFCKMYKFLRNPQKKPLFFRGHRPTSLQTYSFVQLLCQKRKAKKKRLYLFISRGCCSVGFWCNPLHPPLNGGFRSWSLPSGKTYVPLQPESNGDVCNGIIVLCLLITCMQIGANKNTRQSLCQTLTWSNSTAAQFWCLK